MKKAMLFFVVTTLFLVLPLQAKELELKRKVGNFEIILRMDKNPPVVGENGVSVLVKDEKGSFIKEAKVVLEYSMPPMPGMPPMNYRSGTEAKGDAYTGKVNFSMSGAWNVVVKVSLGGKTLTAKYNVDVR